MEKQQVDTLSLNLNIRIPENTQEFDDVFVEDLKKCIPQVYLDASVIEFFKNLLPGKCKSASIEFPYYDPDYLSVYYNYYAKSFRPYKRECCRIVLYGLDNTCVGYITLKPLPKMKKIGKTYLDPTVFAQEKGYIICGQYKVHFQGEESTIEAMPYMQQEKSIAVCAHVCLWSTIRFFASRFSNRSNQTIGDIVENIDASSERKIPSRGLTPSQISKLLMDSGFSSLILRRDSGSLDEAPLTEQLCAYLDSGLPVICVSSSLKHAVVACGRNNISSERIRGINPNYLDFRTTGNEKAKKNTIKLIFEASMVDGIIVNDDNELPYNKVSLCPKISDKDTRRLLKLSQIDVCIVPLDGQMQLSYSAAKDIMRLLFYRKDYRGSFTYKWRKDIEADEDEKNVHFAKISLVSSNTFKEWIKENLIANKLPDQFNVLLRMALPKFLWLGEFALPHDYANGNCSGFILLDPTCATTDATACLVIADNTDCRICKYSSESEAQIVTAFSYDKKFSIPLFRKNYVEVRCNGKEEA